MASSNSPFQRRYPRELRERAVRMVHEVIAESGERVGAVTRVARQLGIGPESLRSWVKQADVDTGKRPGVTSEQQRRIAELERENLRVQRSVSVNFLEVGGKVVVRAKVRRSLWQVGHRPRVAPMNGPADSCVHEHSRFGQR
ncbi:MAG: transposase, partial [Chloroflexi bacterium]|nr:transposase [Chloroflexota bacterium]